MRQFSKLPLQAKQQKSSSNTSLFLHFRRCSEIIELTQSQKIKMNASSAYQTLPEIRRAISLNREELERLRYLLRRQEQYENGSSRHLQTLKEYTSQKHQLEELQNFLIQTRKSTVKEAVFKNRRQLLIALFLVVLLLLLSVFVKTSIIIWLIYPLIDAMFTG